MTLTSNHFENQFNQPRHIENSNIDANIVQIGPLAPEICQFHFLDGGHLGFGRKRGLARSKNFNPMILFLFHP